MLVGQKCTRKLKSSKPVDGHEPQQTEDVGVSGIQTVAFTVRHDLTVLACAAAC